MPIARGSAVVRRPLSRQAKAGWIVAVLLLPFVGTILYWILRKPTEEEIRRGQAASADRRHDDPRAGLGPHPPIDSHAAAARPCHNGCRTRHRERPSAERSGRAPLPPGRLGRL